MTLAAAPGGAQLLRGKYLPPRLYPRNLARQLQASELQHLGARLAQRSYSLYHLRTKCH